MRKVINVIRGTREVDHLSAVRTFIDRPEEQIEADVPDGFNFFKAHDENNQYKKMYGISKYFINENNVLCERTEDSPELLPILKQNKIDELRQRATEYIDKKHAPHKRENASLGLLSNEETLEIKTTITNVRNFVDNKKREILSKKKAETIKSIDTSIIIKD